jgi:hypothetical protein
MGLFPYRRLALRSMLSAADAAQALAKQVEPKRLFRMGGGASAFEGSVTGSHFEIQRVIQYRNSFLPQIDGTIRAETLGCSIAITMRLHPLVLAFGAVWVSIAGTMGLMFLLSALAARSFDGITLVPVGMLAFFFVMVVGGFGYEARKAEQLLVEIFAASHQAAP